jgi:hypothetical protein
VSHAEKSPATTGVEVLPAAEAHISAATAWLKGDLLAHALIFLIIYVDPMIALITQ